jgi:multiple sugar transport system substrate-binding protein
METAMALAPNRRTQPPHTLNSLTRRRLLGGAVGLAALAAGAAGCSGEAVASSGRTRLRYWNLFSGADGDNMNAIEAAFRKANPDVELQANTLAWGAPYYTKLAVAGAGGRAPELGIMHIERLPGFAPGRLLDPWDLGLLAEHGIRPADFPHNLWQRGHLGGEQYAVPIDTHPYVLYYNTDIARKAGLLDSSGALRPIDGTAEFLDVLRTVKKATGRPAICFETIGLGAINPYRMFMTLYGQAGGELLAADNRTIALDDQKALAALEFMRQLTAEGLAVEKTDINAAIALFSNGQTGFLIDGEWDISALDAVRGFHYGMQPIPALFGSLRAQADCHSFVLPHESGRGGGPNRAAYAFAAFLLKHSLMWAQGGHIPAYTPVRESAAYKGLKPQSNYASLAERVVLDPPVWFAGSDSQFWLDLGQEFSNVYTGVSTPQAAVRYVRSRLEKYLATPNPFGTAGGAR